MQSGTQSNGPSNDPRKLRSFLSRVAQLANEHALPSVIIGIAGPDGDLMFPELADFVESALRVEDSIFRVTRERAMLLLADVDRTRAGEILDRLLEDFRQRFPAVRDPEVAVSYFEVKPGTRDVTVKEVLPTLFPARSAASPA